LSSAFDYLSPLCLSQADQSNDMCATGARRDSDLIQSVDGRPVDWPYI
jgi:hypothetical protein